MPLTRSHSTHSRALVAATLLLAVLSFLPARFGQWTNQLQTIPSLVFAPVQGVVYWLASLATREGVSASSAQLHTIEKDRDQWMSIARRFQVENERLRADLAKYVAGAMTPDPGLRFARATVIGPAGAPGSHVLRLRAGSGDGVSRGTVAVVDSVQIVGRVEKAGAATSTLVLITEAGQPPIDAAIFPDGEPGTAPPLMCQLHASGDGTLKGFLEYVEAKAGETRPTARVGHTVHLNDRSWPSSAGMLVLGTIVAMEPYKDSPLRQVITVRPTVKIDRVTEVTLRIPTDDLAQGDSDGRRGGGGP
jgi:cell shape-determining protein MreC